MKCPSKLSQHLKEALLSYVLICSDQRRQQKLQSRCRQQRTKELANAKAELQEITRLVSHELQGPVRLIAALKVRTLNKKGRHVSTTRAIELLETCGIDTQRGWYQPAEALYRK